MWAVVLDALAVHPRVKPQDLRLLAIEKEREHSRLDVMVRTSGLILSVWLNGEHAPVARQDSMSESDLGEVVGVFRLLSAWKAQAPSEGKR